MLHPHSVLPRAIPQDCRGFTLVCCGRCQRCTFAILPPGSSLCSEAIGSPQTSGRAGEILDGVKNEKARRRAILPTNPLTALSVALFTVMSFAVAGAQIATSTQLVVSPTVPAANGSVFTMTATVTATPTPAAGTVTFRDTYNGVTHVLGTVQGQSGIAGSIKGNAVLMQELGGVGTHSIVATFNAPKAYSTSFSAAQTATTTGLYPTTASLVPSRADPWQLAGH